MRTFLAMISVMDEGGGNYPSNALPGAPAYPGNALPGAPVYPGNALPGGGHPWLPGHLGGGHPGNALPMPPNYPSNTLPPGGHIDNSLPSHGHASQLPTEGGWVLIFNPASGYTWVPASSLGGGDTKPVDPAEPK